MPNSFSLEIDPLSSSHGWMDCWLVVDGGRHHLDATSVFSPFLDTLAFAQALAENKLPHEFYWNEEMSGATFKALPGLTDSRRFRLQIDHEREMVVDAEFDRMEIARGLLESLRRVALDCPGADIEWDLPYFLIENFERGLAQGFKKTSDAVVSNAHFVFTQYRGYGGAPSFTIWLDNELALFMAMDDIAHFWEAWFELLELIRYGGLPAEMIFKREPGDNPGLFSFFGPEVVFHFQAVQAMKPDHFQLKIIALHPTVGPEATQTVLDVLLDRRQFVSAFAQSFKHFLETDYLTFLESGENRFDLRILPLDRLVL